MGSYDARQRLRELGATPAEISQIGYVEPEVPANHERIGALIAQHPDIVVIDAAAGVYSLEGLDDNKRGDVEKISSLYIRAFWQNGIATILLDHVVKDGDSRGRYAIGSERKLGGADVHLGFEVAGHAISRGGQGKYKITTHKDRGGYLKRGHLADLNLSSHPETHQIAWSFTEPVVTTDSKGKFRYTIHMERISTHLETASSPMGVNEVKAEISGGARELQSAINSLIDEGYVEVETGPNNSKLLTSCKPYRQAADVLLSEPQTPGDSVVREWFASDSANHRESGGSVVRGSIETRTTRTTYSGSQEPPTSAGWFGVDGQLEDPGRDSYLDSLAPDPDEDE